MLPPVNTEVIEGLSRTPNGRCQSGGRLRTEDAVKWAPSLCRTAVLDTLPLADFGAFLRIAERRREGVAVSLREGAGGRRGLGKSRDAAVGGDGSAERGGPLGALIVTSVDVEGTGTGFSFRGDVSRLRGVARRVYYARG